MVHESPALLSAVQRGVEEAQRKLVPARAGFARITQRMLVMGDGVWRLIEILDKAGSRILKLLPASLLLSLAVPPVLLLP